MESTIGIIEITKEEEFLKIIQLNKAILYLEVDWSGTEKISRHYVLKALNEMHKTGISVYKIDCSNEKKKYLVDWLVVQREINKDFIYGGCGETILISCGKIIDFILNPGRFGQANTITKLNEWKNLNLDL